MLNQKSASRERVPVLELDDDAIDHLMKLDPLAPERVALARVLDDAYAWGLTCRQNQASRDATSLTADSFSTKPKLKRKKVQGSVSAVSREGIAAPRSTLTTINH